MKIKIKVSYILALYALVFLIVFTLKISGVIATSWLWVTALVWLPLIGIQTLLCILGLIALFIISSALT